MSTDSKQSDIQGEGNYEASQNYRKGAERHVKTNDVEQEARDAEPSSKAEREAMEKAEKEGRSHAK